jgi:2-oxo-4-hydroxy-4-carboxy-5-ureidoimidazoline decarboxylase
MSTVLARWNQLSPDDAVGEILPCCSSIAWAREIVGRRPIRDEASLLATSDEVWRGLPAQQWMEAFSKHPRIGASKAPSQSSAQSAAWSAQEQRGTATASPSIQEALEQSNRQYEQKFGRVFIVCATGKSAPEMLDILRRRMQNDEATELREAAEEQRKITNLRLKKWLQT